MPDGRWTPSRVTVPGRSLEVPCHPRRVTAPMRGRTSRRRSPPAAPTTGSPSCRPSAGRSLPLPPALRTLDITPVEAEPGRVSFTLVPSEFHLNPFGLVHGGVLAALIDTAMGCAVHSLLPVGAGYVTSELNVRYLRAAGLATGALTVHRRGAQAGPAEHGRASPGHRRLRPRRRDRRLHLPGELLRDRPRRAGGQARSPVTAGECPDGLDDARRSTGATRSGSSFRRTPRTIRSTGEIRSSGATTRADPPRLVRVRDLVAGRDRAQERGYRQRGRLSRCWRSTSREVVVGMDDRHLDFRVALDGATVRQRDAGGAPRRCAGTTGSAARTSRS